MELRRNDVRTRSTQQPTDTVQTVLVFFFHEILQALQEMVKPQVRPGPLLKRSVDAIEEHRGSSRGPVNDQLDKALPHQWHKRLNRG